MAMKKTKLATYLAKRDFTKTQEPQGAGTAREADFPRFIIQKHAASHLHYDLRLEVGGVFRSWAVTKGPSLNPRDKRLAVEVEEHPLDYGDFEGTIPKGQYGGGTVMLWDRGFWLPEDGIDPTAALEKGELKFTMVGEKLRGRWVLVRMRRQDKRDNWLLIKHRDEFASVEGIAAEDDDKSVASGRSMAQIAAGKGKSPKTFMASAKISSRAIWSSIGAEPKVTSKKRSASKTPMPDFVAPQLCKLVSRAPSGEDWVHEIKLDGYRMQMRVEDGQARMRTRKGLDWTGKFQAIADTATALPDVVIDGEVVALDGNGSPDFSALQAALSEGRSKDLIFFVFDLLFADGRDLRDLSLAERKKLLRELLSRKGPHASMIKFVDHLDEPGDAVLASACRMQLEGIVSKRSLAPYRSGRTDTWVKAKCRAGHEVVIGGWRGTKTNLRSLIVGVHRGDHLVHTGRVGTGFNAKNSSGLLQKLRALATTKNPFGGKDAPRKAADVTWVEPRLVAEIEFAGWTATGQVRQAAFKGLRADKPAREVRTEVLSAETVEPITKIPMRRVKDDKTPNAMLSVTLSHPDKQLWPEGYTKIDLARYLADVGPWMIEHLKGRPCSIIRAPDGIASETFFQRHVMKGMSHLVTLVSVSGDRKPYLQLDTPEALTACAQFSTVEFHPWNSQPGDPNTPGRFIFDLDPAPDVPFEKVVEAAKELRERLERLGFVTFCKTTGGKGLHVVTPFDGAGFDWDQAKMFAQAICGAMAADSPDRYLINMSKAKRTGRIFLDYLRNDRFATAVAPLSPRARPGATVSMPVDWTKVNKRLDPAKYTIETASRVLRRTNPWQDYKKADVSLAKLIKAFIA